MCYVMSVVCNIYEHTKRKNNVNVWRKKYVIDDIYFFPELSYVYYNL